MSDQIKSYKEFTCHIFNSHLLIYFKDIYWSFLPKLCDENIIHFETVFNLIKQFDFKQAIVECNKLKLMFPDIAYYNLAFLHILINDIQGFLKYIKMSIDLDNSDAITYYGIYCHEITKDYDTAKEYYLKAIKLNNARAMKSYAILNHDIIHNYDEAALYYLKAIEHGSISAINNYALLNHFDIKNYAIAEEYYLKSLELCDDCDAINNYAIFLDNIKKLHETAITYYLKAIILGSVDALYNLGNIHIRKGNKMKGLMYLTWASERGLQLAKKRLSNYTSVSNWTKRYQNFLSIK